jgi:hypothetical protein
MESVIGRNAMRRKPASARRNQIRRTQPVAEALEHRRLMSHSSLGHSRATGGSANGIFSRDDRTFTYMTPSGGTAVIQIVGRGNLTGTSIDSSGALHLEYGGTNAFTKITGSVSGGGVGALASIVSSQLVAAGAANSLSGVGGTVLQAVLMSDFDLVAGGKINLTPGVTSVVLNAVGPDTQINLRALPPAPTTKTTTPTSSLVTINTVNGAQGAVVTAFGTTTTTTSSSNTTLQAGQSGTVSSPYGTSTTYISNASFTQTLSAINGQFTSAGNIVEPLPAGQPPQTPPPAPPGVIFKVNHINGNASGAINVLTDSKIFGYDPTTGEVVRFNLNQSNNTATVDSTFTPISVPGDPAVAGLNLGRNGNQLDLLVSSGTTVYAYNATTGAAVGSFTTQVPINSIGSTDILTVLGSYATNQLEAINLAASLQSGTVQPAPGNPRAFTPSPEFTLLGGLTGAPGSNDIEGTIAAHLDTTQPNMTQLGVQSVGTVSVNQIPGNGTVLSYVLSSVGHAAVQPHGAYVNVQPNPLDTSQPGPALGSIDQSLALVVGAANGTNTIDTQSGSISVAYPNLLTGLSQNFRPDLAGTAVIDVQGTVQSVRGSTATGLVLNDTGNLNLVKFGRVTNSTIVGQPVSHLEIGSRSNVMVLTPSRTVAGRNGVTVDHSLKVIGPLSQPND